MDGQACEEKLSSPKLKRGKNRETARACIREGLVYLAVFLLTCLLFLCFKPLTGVYREGVFAKALIAFVLAGVGVFIAYMGAPF